MDLSWLVHVAQLSEGTCGSGEIPFISALFALLSLSGRYVVVALVVAVFLINYLAVGANMVASNVFALRRGQECASQASTLPYK